MSTTNGDESVVRITMKDVYTELQAQGNRTSELSRAVENLTGEMRGTMALLAARSDTANEELKDHEARIRIQENRKTVAPKDMWIGAGVLVSAFSVLLGLLQMLGH